MSNHAIERLLVVSPNWLGDALMALPAIGDLRRHFSSARLIVAARAPVADVFAMSPLVHDVIVVKSSGRLRDRRRRDDVDALRALSADAALLLPNSFASAWLVRRAGIRERWGYARDARRVLLSRAIAPPVIRLHQSEYYRRLVRALGVENGPPEPELRVSDRAIERAGAILREHGRDDESRRFVVMAPGAAYGGAKRWPPRYFAAVAGRLVREQGVQCVLVGAAADAATTGWVRSLVPADARSAIVDLAGATTLETLAGVLAQASACVSNDSGAMHLAAAVGVPLAAIFGPTRERETAPLVARGGRVDVVINHVWCRPCMLRECPLDHRCMNGLSPEQVFMTVSDLLIDPRTRIPDPGPRIPNPESRTTSPESRPPSREFRIPSPE